MELAKKKIERLKHSMTKWDGPSLEDEGQLGRKQLQSVNETNKGNNNLISHGFGVVQDVGTEFSNGKAWIRRYWGIQTGKHLGISKDVYQLVANSNP